MAAPLTCVDCGAAEGVPAYRLCDTCLETRLRADCDEQGVPFTVDDPAVLNRLARLTSRAAS